MLNLKTCKRFENGEFSAKFKQIVINKNNSSRKSRSMNSPTHHTHLFVTPVQFSSTVACENIIKYSRIKDAAVSILFPS